ncbi:MAG: hypothetical protein ACOY40_11715 [Bacillota bacterium]
MPFATDNSYYVAANINVTWPVWYIFPGPASPGPGGNKKAALRAAKSQNKEFKVWNVDSISFLQATPSGKGFFGVCKE